MAIFNSYVKLPEGIWGDYSLCIILLWYVNDMWMGGWLFWLADDNSPRWMVINGSMNVVWLSSKVVSKWLHAWYFTIVVMTIVRYQLSDYNSSQILPGSRLPTGYIAYENHLVSIHIHIISQWYPKKMVQPTPELLSALALMSWWLILRRRCFSLRIETVKLLRRVLSWWSAN